MKSFEYREWISKHLDINNEILYLTQKDCRNIGLTGEEILELTEKYGLIGIREELTQPRKSFNDVIDDLNNIAIKTFNAEQTLFTFLDLILISAENFNEIYLLMQKNQLVLCPAIHSAGISILGRNPPNVVPTFFSVPHIPSFVALLNHAKENGIRKIAIYDSFRAGFDIDIKHDLVLAYEYLKILNLTPTHTFKFLKKNLKLTLQKKAVNNNREFKIIKKN